MASEICTGWKTCHAISRLSNASPVNTAAMAPSTISTCRLISSHICLMDFTIHIIGKRFFDFILLEVDSNIGLEHEAFKTR
jgi:hypothetical protein